MTGHALQEAAFAFAYGPLGSACGAAVFLLRHVPWRLARRPVIRAWLTLSAGYGTGALISGKWPAVMGTAASLAVGLLLWWWDRRNRKRAPRAYGAKSRARVAALVRKAREAAGPRPVLRPVPGGARA